MSDVVEAKIIFTGTVGAGKTTAIRAVREIDAVLKEATAFGKVAAMKEIFTGPGGAGKTTAIRAVREIDAVLKEATAFGKVAAMNETTTVGMDYGEITIDEGLVLRLYGTPGRERFRHMWPIVADGALGFVMLVDNTREDPIRDLCIYLDNFADSIKESGAVVAVTRSDMSPEPPVAKYYEMLSARGQTLPVMTADVRLRGDVLMLLDSLFTTLETE